MRILLDTHLLIWALTETKRLNGTVTRALKTADNEILFSAASIWEIAIKASLDRPDFCFDPADILQAAVQTGFVELPVRAAVALQVAELPLHHRDPFDRLLVAQAIAEPARLYTVDTKLQVYSELVVCV